jgi:hypothetical protein
MGKIFFFSTASRPALGPTQPPIQWVTGTRFPEVKWPEREADHSPQSTAELKNGGAVLSLSHTSSWLSAELIKQRDNFTYSTVDLKMKIMPVWIQKHRVWICDVHSSKAVLTYLYASSRVVEPGYSRH